MANWMLTSTVAPDADVSDVKNNVFETTSATVVSFFALCAWCGNLGICALFTMRREAVLQIFEDLHQQDQAKESYSENENSAKRREENVEEKIRNPYPRKEKDPPSGVML